MRILFLSSVFPHATAPARGTFNLELCRALAVQHAVRVISPRPWPEVVQCLCSKKTAPRGAIEQTGGLDVTYPTFFYPPRTMRSRFGEFMWWSVRRHVKQQLSDFHPQAVVSYWAHPDGEAGLRAAKAARVPSAVVVGGSDVLVITDEASRRKRVVRVLQETSAVVTVSEGLRQKVIQLGVAPSRVHTVYQGIDPALFHPGDVKKARQRLGIPEHPKSLVWVGRMVPIKGLDILLDACWRLRQDGLELTAYLVGDGPLRRALQAEVDRRGLQNCVRFVGTVQHAALPDWYRAADVTVLSSWSEGIPNVLRESLACGTPFASTDVGSIAEIADPAYSALSPPGDAQTLAHSVRSLLTNESRQAACRQSPRTWTDAAQSLESVLRHAGVKTTTPSSENRRPRELVSVAY